MAGAFHVMVEGVSTGAVPNKMGSQYRFLMSVMDVAMEMLNALYEKKEEVQ